MSDNLPAGTTPAEIDDTFGISHEHEWVEREPDYPILEDLAAIFVEECTWAEITNSWTDDSRDETYYEYGAECDATRRWRFELAYVKAIRGDTTVTTHRSAFETFSEPEYEQIVVDPALEAEDRVRNGGEYEMDVDPDHTSGYVIVRWDEYELGYGPALMRTPEDR